MRPWAIIAVAALPCTVGAQTVRGTVTEQASQSPIAGAVVFLVDGRQTIVARDLTTATGYYRLTAPRSGTYRVRTLRIGFRPVMSDAFQIGADQDVTLPLVVESIPVVLNAVRVEQRSNCPPRADATPAYNAWNEVATALNAALLSSRLRGTSATIVGYDRWTQPGSNVILRQGANVRSGLPGQPWRSVSADSLHRAGFVVREANGWYTFHALDLDVLLSDTFLQDHCLQLSDVTNREIAIEFTPSRDRGKIAEVRGFVWLDAATLELRRLQFRYVNVLRHYEQADAGGDLEFLRLRNGSWIISKWQVRMPTAFVQDRSNSYAGMRGSPEVRPTEVKTTGGDVLRLIQNGDTLWSVPPRAFEGKVIDSVTSRPLPGARVSLSGTSYSTATNASGRFRIDDVLPGAYTLHVSTPELDSLATVHHASVILVDQLRSLDIRVPSRDHLLAQWCPAIRRGDHAASAPVGILFGVVTASDSTPVAGGEISIEWAETQVGAVGVSRVDHQATSTTDSRGVYRICGVPTDHRLTLTTVFDGGALPTPLRIESESRIRRYDIALDARGIRR